MPVSHKIIIISFLSIAVISVLLGMIKSKSFIKSLFVSALQGIVALFGINAIGAFTGVTVAVNTYTLVSCSLLGVPAVISALLLDTVFKLI